MSGRAAIAGLVGLACVLAAPSAAVGPSPRIKGGCPPKPSPGYFPGEDRDPVWSPDGRRLLFKRVWPGQICLAVLDLVSGTIRAIDGGIFSTSSPFGD